MGILILIFLTVILVYILPYIIIPLGILFLIYAIIGAINKKNPIAFFNSIRLKRFEKKYYISENFLNLKNSVKKYIDDCNELNDHINYLKNIHIGVKQIDYGESIHYDSSIHDYSRPEYRNRKEEDYVYNCSREICDRARQQPFKYICKYFNIKSSEENLELFEGLLNNFEAARDGIIILEKEKNKILKSIEKDIPKIIKKHGYEKFQYQLGFKIIGINKITYPKYTFLYVSSGGYASTKCDVIMDINNLNKFVNYLASVIKFKKSVAGQRALMTSSLRNKIKVRDNYTCKICGNSTSKEPNLLLEIDHIKPLSKGGMTTEENLRTLCWRCNRSKGSKYDETAEENTTPEIPRISNALKIYAVAIDKNNKNQKVEKETSQKQFDILINKNDEILLSNNTTSSNSEEDIIMWDKKENITKEGNNMFDKEKGIYPSGQYLVGRDIPLGGYILTARNKETAYVQLYPSYAKYKKEEDAITYQDFKDDFHIALMENNTFLVVENADIQKI